MIKYFFLPTNIYPRYELKDNYAAGKTYDGDKEDIDATPTGDIVPDFMADIQSLELVEEN